MKGPTTQDTFSHFTKHVLGQLRKDAWIYLPIKDGYAKVVEYSLPEALDEEALAPLKDRC